METASLRQFLASLPRHHRVLHFSVPSITETYTIAGGTGRFKRASGKFTVERLVDFADVEMDFALTGGVIVGGTITFLNADNAQ